MSLELIVAFIASFHLGLLTMERHMEMKERKERVKITKK